MRRSPLVGARRARVPRGGVGARDASFDVAAFRHEMQRGAGQILLHFDQHVKILPGAVQVLNGVGKQLRRRGARRGHHVVAPVAPLKLGAYTVRWRAMSADSHVVSGVWTFGVRVPAPRGERGVRRRRADHDRACRALAVVPRARARDRRARVPADRACAGSRCRARSSGGSRSQRVSARRRACRRGSPRSRCARRTRCSCRSAKFLYGDLSPMARDAIRRGVRRR